MATKSETVEMLAKGEGCLGKAAQDEPVFVLRGQDIYAPYLVREWARLSEQSGGNPEKIRGARAVAAAMEEWSTKKEPD